MAETFQMHLHDGADWNIEIGGSDYFAGGGDSGALTPISQDNFQRYSFKSDASISTNSGTGQNCKYISATEVSLDGGSTVTLNTGNVSQTDCSARFYYNDDAGNTTLSSIRFFAYEGTPGTAPSNVTVCAFEHDGSAIQTDTDEGAGYGWNANYGVGSNTRGLQLTDQASASNHYFYLGISFKPTSRGQKTFTLRLEFDVT